MSFRVDKAWRQRCSQRFRNILDMVAKKATATVVLHTVVRPFWPFFLHSKKKHFIQVVSGWVFWEWRFFFPRVFHHICVFVSVTVYQCMCIWYPFCIRYILSEYMFLYLSYSHTLVISDHTFWPLRCCNTKLVSKCSREWLGPPNWKTERLGSIFWWWWISHLLGVNVVLFGDRPHLKIRDPSKVVTFKYI